MEIKWITMISENTGKELKQHAIIPKTSKGGNKRNISLCGMLYYKGEDEKPAIFDNIEEGEILHKPTACNMCIKEYNKI